MQYARHWSPWIIFTVERHALSMQCGCRPPAKATKEESRFWCLLCGRLVLCAAGKLHTPGRLCASCEIEVGEGGEQVYCHICKMPLTGRISSCKVCATKAHANCAGAWWRTATGPRCVDPACYPHAEAPSTLSQDKCGVPGCERTAWCRAGSVQCARTDCRRDFCGSHAGMEAGATCCPGRHPTERRTGKRSRQVPAPRARGENR